MVELADKNQKEIRRAKELEVDIEIGTQKNDFEMISSISDWKKDIDFGSYLYVPNTEFGGIVSCIKSSTKDNCIYVKGNTWRGILKKNHCAGARRRFRIVNGELNEVLRELIDECDLGSLFSVPSIDTEVSVTFQFDRYCTLLSGIEKMLNSVGYRIEIQYVKNNAEAYVRLQAVPQIDYSGQKRFPKMVD